TTSSSRRTVRAAATWAATSSSTRTLALWPGRDATLRSARSARAGCSSIGSAPGRDGRANRLTRETASSMPSVLRLVGLAVGILLVLLAIQRLRRRGARSRVPAATILAVGVVLVGISLVPDVVRPIQNVLGLEGEPLGRLVTVLVIAMAVAYVGLFGALGRADRANQ